MDIGDICIDDSTTTHTILQNEKYFSHLTIAKANVGIISGTSYLIKGSRMTRFVLSNGKQIRIIDALYFTTTKKGATARALPLAIESTARARRGEHTLANLLLTNQYGEGMARVRRGWSPLATQRVWLGQSPLATARGSPVPSSYPRRGHKPSLCPRNSEGIASVYALAVYSCCRMPSPRPRHALAEPSPLCRFCCRNYQQNLCPKLQPKPAIHFSNNHNNSLYFTILSNRHISFILD
ncbi:hypothetical protein CFOL_v3_09860 [Cephalotus follicularis]|uniref:Uncharacterized protein n=1 Tax=Cephalotus follicularis TaxID=3775 RepID=A0A1Q3BEC0_CEPFO|nr:hypothetical protein CFOL_v3_09860 [Cephalotus follicularis]